MPLTTTNLHFVEHPWGLHVVHPPKHVVTSDSTIERASALLATIKKTGKNHVLVEAQGSTINLRVRDMRKLLRNLGRHKTSGLHIAVVLPPKVSKSAFIPLVERFCQTMGLHFKSFTDKTMAMRWLISSN